MQRRSDALDVGKSICDDVLFRPSSVTSCPLNHQLRIKALFRTAKTPWETRRDPHHCSYFFINQLIPLTVGLGDSTVELYITFDGHFT